jgi:hypothetical protein
MRILAPSGNCGAHTPSLSQSVLLLLLLTTRAGRMAMAAMYLPLGHWQDHQAISTVLMTQRLT